MRPEAFLTKSYWEFLATLPTLSPAEGTIGQRCQNKLIESITFRIAALNLSAKPASWSLRRPTQASWVWVPAPSPA